MHPTWAGDLFQGVRRRPTLPLALLVSTLQNERPPLERAPEQAVSLPGESDFSD